MTCKVTGTGGHISGFFVFMENDKERIIYVYSDESGTFDYVHNDYFLFAGLIFFGQDEKEIGARKYSHVEKLLRGSRLGEMKGSNLSNAKKGKIYRSLNNHYKLPMKNYKSDLLELLLGILDSCKNCCPT